MLVKNTTPLFPDLFLIKLGDTCRYLVTSDDGSILIVDPGASVHVGSLLARVQDLGLDPSKYNAVFLTHAHHDRIGATVGMRVRNPGLQIFASKGTAEILSDSASLRELCELDRAVAAKFDYKVAHSYEDWQETFSTISVLEDGSGFELGCDRVIQTIATPGHSYGSVAFLLSHHKCLIVDETCGYFNGNKLAGPGGDFDMDAAAASLQKICKLDVALLGLPYYGVLTGNLLTKHLNNVYSNHLDLRSEVTKAVAQEVPLDTVKQAICDSFYKHESRDPIVQEALRRTYARITEQALRHNYSCLRKL